MGSGNWYVGWYGNANANDMRADIVLEGNAWVWFIGLIYYCNFFACETRLHMQI